MQSFLRVQSNGVAKGKVKAAAIKSKLRASQKPNRLRVKVQTLMSKVQTRGPFQKDTKCLASSFPLMHVVAFSWQNH